MDDKSIHIDPGHSLSMGSLLDFPTISFPILGSKVPLQEGHFSLLQKPYSWQYLVCWDHIKLGLTFQPSYTTCCTGKLHAGPVLPPPRQETWLICSLWAFSCIGDHHEALFFPHFLREKWFQMVQIWLIYSSFSAEYQQAIAGTEGLVVLLLLLCDGRGHAHQCSRARAQRNTEMVLCKRMIKSMVWAWPYELLLL